MGLTFIEGTVTEPTGPSRNVEFLVDGGVTYSLLPLEVWQAVGLQAKRSLSFTLADGTTISRKVSECHLAVAGQEGHSPVILGEPDDDQALLGIVTLENLGLILDPFKRRLRPMQLRLA